MTRRCCPGVVVSGTGQAAPGTTTLTLDPFGLVTAKTFSGGSSGSLSYVYDAASQGITSAETIGAFLPLDSVTICEPGGCGSDSEPTARASIEA